MCRTGLVLTAILFMGCNIRSNWTTSILGGNWIVLMHNAQGAPLRCWKLKDTTVGYGPRTVSWRDPQTKAEMNIHGYNVTAIKLADDNWAAALAIMGYSLKDCKTIQGKEPENPVEEEGSTRPPNGP